MRFTDKLSGKQGTLSTIFNWHGSTATSGIVLRLERLNMPTVSDTGDWLSPRKTKATTPTGLKAAGTGASMPSTTWQAMQRQGTMWRDVNWSVPNYPGRWYQMAKSVVFFQRGDDLGLNFYSDETTPGQPANAGWNP
jgi:hypothetical protein